MKELAFYGALSRFKALNYRAKIMVVAFLGTHVPLLAIIGFYLLRTSSDMATVWSTLAVALVATLAGTAVTLLVLNQLLQPVLMTSRALRSYRTSRTLMPLPSHFRDEVGTLMADASATLAQLDRTVTELETLDPVTGLPNRDRFLSLVQAAIGRGKPFAVGVIRLGNLPRVRTTYTSDRADSLARAISVRLVDHFGPGAEIGRVDALSFAVILDVADAADRIVAAKRDAQRPLSIAGVEMLPEIGAGVALSPEDGASAAELVDNAVAASPNNNAVQPVSYHSAKAREDARDRFVLEQELRQAIAGNQLTLHFQPVVDLKAGRATGAEALIRWQHPVRGLVAPGLFIPAAERSGLIDDIGEWVIRQACAQIARWGAEGVDPLKVAVNVSSRQFLDPRLVGVLTEAMQDARIGADRVEIELTESAAMADYDHTRKTFGRLRDLGISVAIDDFGTGYASMSYLRSLPFSKLKIDREFVSHIDTNAGVQAISNAMVALGHGLGLKVLAEGTERPEEVAYLAEHGVDLFQGFYFSRPVKPADIPEALEDIRMRLVALGDGEDEAVRRSA